jgi:hypothetical protein
MSRSCSTNGEKRNAYRILVGKPEGNKSLEDLDVDDAILKWLLESGVVWIGSIWLRLGICGWLS